VRHLLDNLSTDLRHVDSPDRAGCGPSQGGTSRRVGARLKCSEKQDQPVLCVAGKRGGVVAQTAEGCCSVVPREGGDHDLILDAAVGSSAIVSSAPDSSQRAHLFEHDENFAWQSPPIPDVYKVVPHDW